MFFVPPARKRHERRPPFKSWNWTQHCKNPTAPGRIRILADPTTAPNLFIRSWWFIDRTLTEWYNRIQEIRHAIETKHISAAFYPKSFADESEQLFYATQRQRWLVHKVVNRWRFRMWSRRPQCGVNLIDMEPVPDDQAVNLTDTQNRMVYRFHRKDLFDSLLSKLTLSDDMLPMPRPPANPWTNAHLTLAQTIGVCQMYIADCAARGRCPPPIFAAFVQSRYDTRRLYEFHSAMLSQHAIARFFADINDDNLDSIQETIIGLLNEASVDFTVHRLSHWLAERPLTPLHREWLALARDYTLYINLHIQARRYWYSQDEIQADVRVLFGRSTPFHSTFSSRIRMLRSDPVAANTIVNPFLQPPGILSILGGSPPHPPMGSPMLDPSGNPAEISDAMQLILSALLRM